MGYSAFETLRQADVSMSVSEYDRLRAELARLFDLRGPDFTMRDLRAMKRYSTHHPAEQNEYATMGTTGREGLYQNEAAPDATRARRPGDIIR